MGCNNDSSCHMGIVINPIEKQPKTFRTACSENSHVTIVSIKNGCLDRIPTDPGPSKLLLELLGPMGPISWSDGTPAPGIDMTWEVYKWPEGNAAK